MINYKLCVKNLINKHSTSNPFDLAKALGLKIICAPLPCNIRGFLVRVLKRRYIILNDTLCYQVQKITICHEIGHAQLHKGYGYYFMQTIHIMFLLRENLKQTIIQYIYYPTLTILTWI